MHNRYFLFLIATLVTALAFFSVAPASAQIGSSSSPDPQVRRALDQEGWSYEVVEDGDFEIVVEFNEGRSQLVYVVSETQEVDGMEIREVWSPIYVQQEDAQVPNSIAQWALQMSTKLNMGSLGSTGKGVVHYTIKMDANASPAFLSKIIETASAIGDELEKRKSTGDDL